MKALACTILSFVLGTMFLSLFHMSTDMDMTGSMSDCPFMLHEEVLCPMNLTDHLGAWKSAFLAIMPTMILLFATAGAVAIAISAAPNLVARREKSIPVPQKLLRERVYTYSYRQLQELFSKGILHPKLF